MILRRPPVVLLDNALSGGALLFSQPKAVLIARTVEQVRGALEAADAARAAGKYVAGVIAYEAAAAFEPRMAAAIGPLPAEPLIWLGVFDRPQRLGRDGIMALLDDAMGGTARTSALAMGTWPLDQASYAAKIAEIKSYLNSGDIYQLNYTFPVPVRLTGDPLALYCRLRASQPVGHGAYIDTGAHKILSSSPELFVYGEDGRLTARPMKGTAPRGADLANDEATAARLAADPKSRAENLMIADLLRNDLSRVAATGSVRTPRLFEIERYRGVLQMTSTVTADLPGNWTLAELLGALFPCGSVTGAPKIRAMELIGASEHAPRGVYTGAIGWAGPRVLRLSVAIRTVVLNSEGEGRFGVGSGIVADSDAKAEYEECRLKAAFLAGEVPDFALLETLLFTPAAGLRHFDRHLARMSRAARYFGFVFDERALRDAADSVTFERSTPARIRLMLAASGAVSAMASPHGAESRPAPVKLAFAPTALDSRDPFVRHKTTHRHHYEAPLAEAKAACGTDEVIFLNESGEVTEGARHSLFVARGDELLTPSAACGLLPGILREILLEEGRARECRLTPDDIKAADALHVGNAVRGLRPARLLAHAPAPENGDDR